jgi:hypothetical protein
MREKVEELQKRCNELVKFCEENTEGICQMQAVIKIQEVIWWALKGFAEKGSGDVPKAS